VKETVATEYPSARIVSPHGAARLDRDAIQLRSQIVWGEHCSECAFPSCYARCSFYDPRPDLHCRRFATGIEAAADGVTRIRFRKWGKLEGEGPARVGTFDASRRRERRDALVSRALAHAPLPSALSRYAAWRWNTAKSQAASDGSDAAMDAFVIEGWSLDGQNRPFTVTFLQQDGGRGIFQRHFELRPELRRTTIPVADISAHIRLDQAYLVQIEPVGDAEGVDVAFGLTDFVSFRRGVADVEESGAGVSSAPVKVLVWDLDETLWTGTLAEDGVSGVALRPEAAECIRALDARGVLQSIASKNDPAEALVALERMGLAEYFLHPEIGWGPKSESIRRIAARLDIGLDTFVFIDDQPFERAEVTSALPKVRILPHDELSALLTHPWFDLPATPEAGRRRAMYRAEADRQIMLEASKGDYLAFLRASGLTLDVNPLQQHDLERVHELSQRTNQLNFTGAKLTIGSVEAMLVPDRHHARLTCRCSDRYGEYGLIAFADVDLVRGELVTFFMSCRVQRKRVEHALFALIARMLSDEGHTEFLVRFRPTERNGASVRLLTELGFAQGVDTAVWTRDIALPFPDANVVRLTGGAAAVAQEVA
jgi:FkbH-like protein